MNFQFLIKLKERSAIRAKMRTLLVLRDALEELENNDGFFMYYSRKRGRITINGLCCLNVALGADVNNLKKYDEAYVGDWIREVMWKESAIYYQSCRLRSEETRDVRMALIDGQLKVLEKQLNLT